MFGLFEKREGRDFKKECLDDLHSFRDVGQKFSYMGVEMMVENLGERTPYGFVSRIQAVYKNDKGELKREYFYRRDLSLLKAENQ